MYTYLSYAFLHCNLRNMMHHIPRMDNISKIFHLQSKLIDTVHEVSASNHMNEDSYVRQPCILVDSAKF